MSGEHIKGSFYGEELQVVDKPETFTVESGTSYASRSWKETISS